MKKNNIVQFPISRVVRENLQENSDEKVKANIDNIKHSHIEETLSLIIPMVFQKLLISGFDVAGYEEDEDEDDDADVYLKDNAFIVECLRSLMSKYYDIFHPLQIIAQNVFIEEESGLLSYKNDINLNLSDNDDDKGVSE